MTEPADELRKRLNALPGIPLPDSLWQRVEAGRRQKIRRRKLGGGIATLAIAAVMAVPLLTPMFTDAPAVQGVRGIAQEPTGGGPADGRSDTRAELRALDQALQAAYDRGASDAEIAPMWVTRETLLPGIGPVSPVFRPDRI